MDRSLVGANHDTAPPVLLELADGGLSLSGKAQQSGCVFLQQGARLGQRAVSGRPVEELVAEFVFQAPDSLADGRLCAVKLLGSLRETAIRGDGNEGIQVLQLHTGVS